MSEVTDGKAKIKVFVRLDESGCATAVTQDEIDDGCSINDSLLDGNTRDICIEVTASMPAKKIELEDVEPSAAVDVPDEPKPAEGDVAAQAVPVE